MCQDNHAAQLARFRTSAVGAARQTPVDPDDPSNGKISIRVGLHAGLCMASVGGRKSPKQSQNRIEQRDSEADTQYV